MIALQDLEKYTEKQVLAHLANSYSGETSGFDYGSIGKKEIKAEYSRRNENNLMKNNVPLTEKPAVELSGGYAAV